MTEKRFRVYRDDGTSFLAHKGETMAKLKSWKSAFNKNAHKSYGRVGKIVEVSPRKKAVKKAVKQKIGYSVAELMRM